MGKRLLAAGLLLLLAVSAACSGRDFELDPAGAAETILAGVTFTDTLLPVPENQLSNYYPRLAEVSDEYAVYISSTGLTTEEFAVAKAKEGFTAEDITALFDNRLEEQRFRYESYLPEQAGLLDSFVLETRGGYAVMIICGDPGKAAEVASGLFD